MICMRMLARILKLLCINSLSNLGAPDIVDSNSIHTTSRSFTSVSVQWTTPQDNYDAIRYYRLQLGKCEISGNSSSPCQPVRTQQYQSSSNSLYHTFDNLSPFTTYILEMAAYNGVGLGPYSNAVEVQTVQPGWPYYQTVSQSCVAVTPSQFMCCADDILHTVVTMDLAKQTSCFQLCQEALPAALVSNKQISSLSCR